LKLGIASMVRIAATASVIINSMIVNPRGVQTRARKRRPACRRRVGPLTAARSLRVSLLLDFPRATMLPFPRR
jgi:hypothetical protein